LLSIKTNFGVFRKKVFKRPHTTTPKGALFFKIKSEPVFQEEIEIKTFKLNLLTFSPLLGYNENKGGIMGIERNEENNTIITIPKMNLLLTIFLFLITLSLYEPIWYLKRGKYIRDLRVSTTGIAITTLILSFLQLFIVFLLGSDSAIGNIFWLIGWGLSISMAFTLRNGILESLKKSEEKTRYTFYGFFTFLFRFFYVQYKINRIIEKQDQEKMIGRSKGNIGKKGRVEKTEDKGSHVLDIVSRIKKKFSKDEWESLKLLPFQIFIAIAGADRKIDTKEKRAFVDFLKEAPFLKESLIKELFLDILSSADFESYYDTSFRGGWRGFVDNLKRQKEILEQKLDSEEYQIIVGGFFVMAYSIANASGEILGTGERICKEEADILDLIISIFNIDFKRYSSDFEEESKLTWVSLLPGHLQPEKDKIERLEKLRTNYSIPNRLFALRILSSPASTVKVQEYNYREIKKSNPNIPEKEILKKILIERLNTPPITAMPKEEINKATKNVNSLNDLCDFVIALDEKEPVTPDPFGIGRKIDEILAGDTVKDALITKKTKREDWIDEMLAEDTIGESDRKNKNLILKTSDGEVSMSAFLKELNSLIQNELMEVDETFNKIYQLHYPTIFFKVDRLPVLQRLELRETGTFANALIRCGAGVAIVLFGFLEHERIRIKPPPYPKESYERIFEKYSEEDLSKRCPCDWPFVKSVLDNVINSQAENLLLQRAWRDFSINEINTIKEPFIRDFVYRGFSIGLESANY